MVWTLEAVQAEMDYRWHDRDEENRRHVAEARRLWRLRRRAQRGRDQAAEQADGPGTKAA